MEKLGRAKNALVGFSDPNQEVGYRGKAELNGMGFAEPRQQEKRSSNFRE